jgi:transposase
MNLPFTSTVIGGINPAINTMINTQEYNQAHNAYALMDVEAIQKALGRSRASVYRYANTDPRGLLNLPYDPTKLNPELRQSDHEPLLFHPTEVSRFARDVLKIKEVTIQVQEPSQNETNRLLREILQELRSLNQSISALGDRSPFPVNN